MAIWQQIPSSMNLRKANNFKDGLDTQSSPLFVPENGMVDGYGWDFDQYPALQVRTGRTAYGSAGTGMTHMIAPYSDQYLVRIVGTQIQYNSSGTTWTTSQGTIEDKDADYANFDNVGTCLIIVNGSNGYMWKPSGFGILGDMPAGKYVTADNLRVYTAGVEDKEDWLYYCAFQDVEDWTTAENSGAVQYFTAGGGPITALHAFGGAVWIFKKDSFAILYHTGDARLSYRLQPISDYIGCVAYRTLVEVGPYLMWLGQDNVYIGGGDAARQVGEPIRRYLDNLNKAAVSNAFAFSTNERYYLCIPTGSNTQPDTCLVYDYVYRQWLPYSISLGGLRAGARFNGIPYAGDANGQTFKMNDGTTDNGTPIPWMVQSRPYDDGVKEAEKELHHMHIQGYFPSGTTVNVDVSPDDNGDEWYGIDYDPTGGSSGVQSKRLIVPLDTVPLCNFYAYRISGTGQAQVAEIQRYSRIMPVQE